MQTTSAQKRCAHPAYAPAFSIYPSSRATAFLSVWVDGAVTIGNLHG
jgi:hypothetical protein